MKRGGRLTGFGAFIARAAVVATAALVLTTCNQSLLKYLIEQGGVSDLELPMAYLYLEIADQLRAAELFDPERPEIVGGLPDHTFVSNFTIRGTY